MRTDPSGRLIRRLRRGLGCTAFAALLVFAAWPWITGPGAAAPRTVVFYGFSILGTTMEEAIFPGFRQHWRSLHGTEVEVISSFAASGTVTNQIIMGVPADLALLSVELDALRLADAGVVEPAAWRSLPDAGVVNRTPFVILVRPGNPKGIRDFEDLTRPGVGVVHPDPLTSGGAAWAILAEYGAGLRRPGGSPEEGYRLLLGVWRNVIALAASARAARTQFDQGFGDALVTYEQEALYDIARGRLAAEVVYPRATILSEHTLVPISRNISTDAAPIVDALVEYLWTEAAQREFVARGFRSILPHLDAANPAFGHIEAPFYVADLGGWERANKEIVQGVWRQRVLVELGR